MRRWGALRAVALAGLAAVLLSGCLKLDVNLTVRSDDKVDGTLIVAVDKKVAALLPGGAANLDQLITNGERPEINGAEDVQATPYQDDQYVGQQVTFKGAPLEEAGTGLGSDAGDLSIKHDGDVYRLTGSLDLTLGDLSNLPDDVTGGINPEEALANSVVRIQVTFPGKVQSSNGTNDGCSVTWEPKFGAETELTAVANDGGGCRDGLRWWAWPLFGLGLLVLIGACIAIIRVLKKEREKDRKAAGGSGGETSGEARGEGLAPPAAGLAPPVVSDLAPPTAPELAPPAGAALAAPLAEGAPDAGGAEVGHPASAPTEPAAATDVTDVTDTADTADTTDVTGATDAGWPPPGSNVPPPPDTPHEAPTAAEGELEPPPAPPT